MYNFLICIYIDSNQKILPRNRPPSITYDYGSRSFVFTVIFQANASVAVLFSSFQRLCLLSKIVITLFQLLKRLIINFSVRVYKQRLWRVLKFFRSFMSRLHTYRQRSWGRTRLRLPAISSPYKVSLVFFRLSFVEHVPVCADEAS